MLVFKCPKCGTIYSKREVPQNEMCSYCYIYLKVVNIKEDIVSENSKKEESLSKAGNQSNVGRVRITQVPPRREERKDETINKTQELYRKVDNQENSSYSCSQSVNKVESENIIEGTIISAVNDTGFRRLPWEKLYDRFFYSQNVSNIQNSIYVRCVDRDGNISNKTVVKYGQIRGGIGMFRTGMRIKAEGKTNRRNEFVAKSLLLEDNIGVSTRTEFVDIIYYISPLLLIFICALISYFTGFIKGIVSSGYLKWYFISIIGTFFVLYFAIGRVIRIPVVNRVRICTWVSIILGSIIFFICKSMFVI